MEHTPPNADRATRYEVELECGHTMINSYAPLNNRSKVVCRTCPDLSEPMKMWCAYTDTLRGIRIVRTNAA